MGLHDPFGFLKHKLWPKERPGVKLSIWLLTIKSQESPWFFTCRWHATYRWKAFDEGYNFVSNLNQRSAHKVIRLQSHRSLNFKNFEIPTWELWDKMTFGCWPCGQVQRILYGGKWWFPPSLGRGEFYEFVFAYSLSVHQKYSSYALLTCYLVYVGSCD